MKKCPISWKKIQDCDWTFLLHHRPSFETRCNTNFLNFFLSCMEWKNEALFATDEGNELLPKKKTFSSRWIVYNRESHLFLHLETSLSRLKVALSAGIQTHGLLFVHWKRSRMPLIQQASDCEHTSSFLSLKFDNLDLNFNLRSRLYWLYCIRSTLVASLLVTNWFI